jgi:uncharacterized iron-regulated protein
MSKLYLIMILTLIGFVCHAGEAVNAVPVAGQTEKSMTVDESVEDTPALALDSFSTLQSILPGLADKRVVFVGELHPRYDHHLGQLEIIRRMHAQDPRLAIGMEMFQQPFQSVLDDYVTGAIDVDQMLRDTQYYRRWRMDFRLYAPILEYAREQGIPVIALNLPTELTRKVGRAGLQGLDDDERRQLPADTAPADEDYRQRIRAVFDMHPKHENQSFEHFLEAQLLWDEGMAERAAGYLETHPGYRMVVIAGNQHVAWGSAMPQRLQRRQSVPMATILNSWQGEVAPGLADYLLTPAERSLPPAGKMGVTFEEGETPVIVTACTRNGACADAGIKKGDRIAAIDNAMISNPADLRLALWDKRPGDTIHIAIVRQRLLLRDRKLDFELTLK